MLCYLSDIIPDVESTVPEGYKGCCKVIFKGSSSHESFAIFPNFDEAESAAHIAVNPTVGGYIRVRIEAATEAITYDTALDWLND
jgi:hypothetical protein